MTHTIRVRPVADVPAGTRVRHYDELPEDAKADFPAIAATGGDVVPPAIAAGFRHGEVVKFTEYYRIEVLEDSPSVGIETRT